MPRLRLRYGVLATGLIVGVLWGAWHILGHDIWASVAIAGDLPLALFVVLRVLAILMHASYDACTFILGPLAGPGAMSGSSLLAYELVLAAALWIVVGVVAVANGGHLSRQPLSSRRVA